MSLSDSDEAPEEVTFQDSKASIRRQERQLQEAASAAKRASKDKRRARDQRLKDQQSDRKQRERLQQLLREEMAKEESEDADEEDETPISIPKTPKLKNKPISLEKQGVTVTVAKPRITKKLPPAGKSAVSLRDRFLFRDQNPRK